MQVSAPLLCCTAELSPSLLTLESPALSLGVARKDSVTSLTSHNKHTFQRFIGSFRTAVGGRDEGADTLPGE